MNWLDLLILLPLIGGIISGYKNGLIGEIASLAGLILGIWGAIVFSGWTAELLESLGLHLPYMNVIAFVITFLLIVILLQVISGLLSKLVETLLLGWVNRLTGIVAGMLKALLFVAVILYVIEVLDDRRTIIPPQAKAQSAFYEPVSNIVPALLPFIPIEKLFGDEPDDEEREDA